MKNNELNKNILRAISIGLAATLTLMPTVTAFADDGEGGGDGGGSSTESGSESSSESNDNDNEDSHDDHDTSDSVSDAGDDVETAADECGGDDDGGSGGGDDGGSTEETSSPAQDSQDDSTPISDNLYEAAEDLHEIAGSAATENQEATGMRAVEDAFIAADASNNAYNEALGIINQDADGNGTADIEDSMSDLENNSLGTAPTQIGDSISAVEWGLAFAPSQVENASNVVDNSINTAKAQIPVANEKAAETYNSNEEAADAKAAIEGELQKAQDASDKAVDAAQKSLEAASNKIDEINESLTDAREKRDKAEADLTAARGKFEALLKENGISYTVAEDGTITTNGSYEAKGELKDALDAAQRAVNIAEGKVTEAKTAFANGYTEAATALEQTRSDVNFSYETAYNKYDKTNSDYEAKQAEYADTQSALTKAQKTSVDFNKLLKDAKTTAATKNSWDGYRTLSFEIAKYLILQEDSKATDFNASYTRTSNTEVGGTVIDKIENKRGETDPFVFTYKDKDGNTQTVTYRFVQDYSNEASTKTVKDVVNIQLKKVVNGQEKDWGSNSTDFLQELSNNASNLSNELSALGDEVASLDSSRASLQVNLDRAQAVKDELNVLDNILVGAEKTTLDTANDNADAAARRDETAQSALTSAQEALISKTTTLATKQTELENAEALVVETESDRAAKEKAYNDAASALRNFEDSSYETIAAQYDKMKAETERDGSTYNSIMTECRILAGLLAQYQIKKDNSTATNFSFQWLTSSGNDNAHYGLLTYEVNGEQKQMYYDYIAYDSEGNRNMLGGNSGKDVYRIVVVDKTIHNADGTVSVDTTQKKVKDVIDKDEFDTDAERYLIERAALVTARDNAQTEYVNAVTARDNAVTARDNAVTARDNAVTDKNNAEAARDQAAIIANLTSSIKGYAVTIKNLKQSEQDATDLRTKVAAAQGRVTEAERVLANAQENRNISITSIKALEDRLQNAQDELADLQKQLGDVEKKADELRSIISDVRAILNRDGSFRVDSGTDSPGGISDPGSSGGGSGSGTSRGSGGGSGSSGGGSSETATETGGGTGETVESAGGTGVIIDAAAAAGTVTAETVADTGAADGVFTAATFEAAPDTAPAENVIVAAPDAEVLGEMAAPETAAGDTAEADENIVSDVLGERAAPIVDAVKNGTFTRKMLFDEDAKKLPFAWWLLFFVLGATGVGIYVKHKKKRS